jgi:hypothetical protein
MKSGKTVDYRIHHGMVGGRRVKGQEAHIVRLADGVYKLSWDESTGTTVSVAIKKRGRRSVPFQGSRGRGKNVCCTAESRRKFRTSAAPKIDNTAGRGAPCERAIFLRHNPLANAGEGQYTRLVFPPPVPPTAVRPATVPPATVGPATVVATPPVVMRPPVVMAPPPVVIMPAFRTF